jgi:hypothetical protein
MTHNEKRTDWWKEGVIGAIIGIQYGVIQASVGHPFDTIKTKMQVQEDFKKLKFAESIKKVYKKEGIVGFYRGAAAIALGSSIFRSAQFSAFEAVHSRFDKSNLKNKNYEKFFTYVIPHTKGLEIRTVAGGLASGICRSLAECPFEFIKVRKQVKTEYSYRQLYHGLLPLMLKNSLMIMSGFSLIDTFRRNTNAWNSSVGVFLVSGFSTLVSHIFIWPIEIFRNSYMAKNRNEVVGLNVIMKDKIKTHGLIFGTFRGALPGLISTFIRNGLAIALLQKLQKLFTYLGFRA